jgi:hypothetical protein
MMLTCIQTSFLLPCVAQNTPMAEHDARSFASTSDIGDNANVVSDSSGVVFLSEELILQYVLHSKAASPVPGATHQAIESYILTLSLFDIGKNGIVAKTELPVPSRIVHVFRSHDGSIIVATQGSITLLSPELSVTNNVPMDERLGSSYIRSAVDIDGSHVYLSGESRKECPQVVQVLRADSLIQDSWWCLENNQRSSFYGETAAEYHPSRDANITVYHGGHRTDTFALPGMLFISEATLLPENRLIATDGDRVVSFQLSDGVNFALPIGKKGNIASPFSCTSNGDACAAIVAVPKSNVLDVKHETTFKDAQIIVFNSQSGGVRLRQSIHQSSHGNRIVQRDVSETKVVISPNGRRAAAWYGSAWALYSIP